MAHIGQATSDPPIAGLAASLSDAWKRPARGSPSQLDLIHTGDKKTADADSPILQNRRSQACGCWPLVADKGSVRAERLGSTPP